MTIRTVTTIAPASPSRDGRPIQGVFALLSCGHERYWAMTVSEAMKVAKYDCQDSTCCTLNKDF